MDEVTVAPETVVAPKVQIHPLHPYTKDPKQADGPSADEMRNILASADAQGVDELAVTPAQPVPQAQATPAIPTTQPIDVPDKFKKADGTVDVEKIQTSSKQLDEAIAEKEQKLLSIEDVIAEYREKEKKFRELPNPEKLVQSVAPIVPPIPSPQAVASADPSISAIMQRIQEDYRNDPIGTTVDLNRVIVRKEMEPLMKYIEEQKAIDQEKQIKAQISELGEKDNRFLRPEFFEEVKKEMRADPHYWNLKNPYKAAWNEVKERLRLSEQVTPAPAQLSKAVSPILGGGVPPPSPSQSSAPITPLDVMRSIPKIKSEDEMKRVEDAIRELMSKAV